MIKSKTNTIGFWMTPIMTPFFIGMLLLFLLKYNPKESIAPLVLASTFLVLNISQLLHTAKVITVNTILGTVTFKHILTRRETIIDFKNIDGYVDVIEKPARGRGSPFRIIFLVKDGRFVQKISGFIYSNVGEMEEGLKGIPYLGRKKYSYLKTKGCAGTKGSTLRGLRFYENQECINVWERSMQAQPPTMCICNLNLINYF